MQIRTKSQSMALLHGGAFGNKARSWTPAQFLNERPAGLFGFRYTQGGSPFKRYDIPADEVEAAILAVENAGGRRDRIIISEMMPDHVLRLQGEVCYDYRGWYLFGSTLPLPMTPALQQAGQEWTGLAALGRLRAALDQPSFEQLEWLLERYPDHVVEFSAYDRRVGELQLNSVFWDCRSF